MTFDDGAADRQADPHPGLFGRVERLEELVDVLQLQTDPGVVDGDAYAVAPFERPVQAQQGMGDGMVGIRCARDPVRLPGSL
jgi:hypothetical protein